MTTDGATEAQAQASSEAPSEVQTAPRQGFDALAHSKSSFNFLLNNTKTPLLTAVMAKVLKPKYKPQISPVAGKPGQRTIMQTFNKKPARFEDLDSDSESVTEPDTEPEEMLHVSAGEKRKRSPFDRDYSAPAAKVARKTPAAVTTSTKQKRKTPADFDDDSQTGTKKSKLAANAAPKAKLKIASRKEAAPKPNIKGFYDPAVLYPHHLSTKQQSAHAMRTEAHHEAERQRAASKVTSGRVTKAPSVPRVIRASSRQAELKPYSGKGKGRAVDSDPEVSESDENYSEAEEQKPKKKGKKTGNKSDWVGTPTGKGTTVERPSDATEARSWNCANRGCDTGMTWLKRDGAGSVGRKSISEFFGRNKKSTSIIHNDVWHNYCRKCYQRTAYNNKKNGHDATNAWKVKNIKIQVNRIQLWRPEAKFKVQLSRAMNDRLGEYFQILDDNDGDVAQALSEYNEKFEKKPRTTSKKSNDDTEPKKKSKTTETKKKSKNTDEITISAEDACPIQVAQEFKRSQAGENFDFVRLYKVIHWIEARLASGVLTQLPPIEFLINEIQPKELLYIPKNNYNNWAQQEDDFKLAVLHNLPDKARTRDEASQVYTNAHNFIKFVEAVEAMPDDDAEDADESAVDENPVDDDEEVIVQASSSAALDN